MTDAEILRTDIFYVLGESRRPVSQNVDVEVRVSRDAKHVSVTLTKGGRTPGVDVPFPLDAGPYCQEDIRDKLDEALRKLR